MTRMTSPTLYQEIMGAFDEASDAHQGKHIAVNNDDSPLIELVSMVIMAKMRFVSNCRSSLLELSESGDLIAYGV